MNNNSMNNFPPYSMNGQMNVPVYNPPSYYPNQYPNQYQYYPNQYYPNQYQYYSNQQYQQPSNNIYHYP